MKIWHSRFNATFVFLSCLALYAIKVTIALATFNNARDVKLLPILHEISEEDTRGSKLLLGGLRSRSPIDDESFAHYFLFKRSPFREGIFFN